MGGGPGYGCNRKAGFGPQSRTSVHKDSMAAAAKEHLIGLSREIKNRTPIVNYPTRSPV